MIRKYYLRFGTVNPLIHIPGYLTEEACTRDLLILGYAHSEMVILVSLLTADSLCTERNILNLKIKSENFNTNQ